ncbi:MAG: hypothetical protein KGN02_03940 [bacterium]|nr:hypothetical protein [bacterium]
MTYVEWLRVRNVLRVVAIVLGALILIAGIVRLSVIRMGSVDDMIHHVQTEPGTKKTVSTLPDGTIETILVAPDGKRIVVDDHGYDGKHIVITGPSKDKSTDTNHLLLGSLRIDQSSDGKETRTTVDTNSVTPFFFILGFAEFVGLIVATVLAAPFARENDGHLELALTKPIGRAEFALRTMGVDALGIVAAGALSIVAQIVIQAIFQIPHYDFGGLTLFAVMMSVVLPLAWYAMLNAATASMRRNYGALLGLAWPIAAVITVFANLTLGGSIVGNIVHAIFWALSRLIPLSYASFTPSHRVAMGAVNVGDPDFFSRFAIICALLVVYGALAVWQWRRVEA